ncbi:MAG TPA: RNA 2',3'-cyclic phosphodiesterase [Povalibacter sp.]|nr:RNA 2',3'-cyclic phosphodiesterase [Povalibacter sp.]
MPDRAAGLPTRRLFFALWPTDELRRRIERDTALIVGVAGGRRIPAASFHVTVLFIGEVAHSQVAEVMAAADAAAAPAFELTLDTVEAWKDSRVVALAGAAAPPELSALADSLRISLLHRQIKLKRQDLRPHITLVRKFARAPTPAQAPPVVRWRVNEFVLVESQMARGGSQYSVIGRWPLA